MKRKSVTIKAAWISGGFIVLAAIIGGVFSLLSNRSEKQNTINNSFEVKDSSTVSLTNNQKDIKGDFIEGNKIINNYSFDTSTIYTKKVKYKSDFTNKEKSNAITAPNALIVTQNQSGGENTVNINQISSQSYQEISYELNSILNSNFDLLVSKYKNHPKMIIEVEGGNSMRDKIARDLENFLIPRELGNYPKGNAYIGRFPDYPITMLTSNKNLNFSIDFIKIIEPYIESRFFIDTAFISDNFVKLCINGIPTFNKNGMIKIE